MARSTSPASVASLPHRTLRAPWAILLGRVLGHYLGAVGVFILAVVVLLAIFAPWIAPYNPAFIDYDAFLTPPSSEHWFGTDELGRDVLSRVIHGARISLHIVSVAVLLAMAAGSAIGMVSGHVGGWMDGAIMRLMDAMLAFPFLVMTLTIVAVLGPDLMNAVFAIALAKVPGFARLVRADVLTLRSVDYISAARAVGAGHMRLIFRHIWPNVTGNVVVYASLSASQALITESALSFLGLGVRPPTPSWGYMVAVGMDNWLSWWASFFPGLAIFLTVLAFNFLGDAIRDAMDSRLADLG